MLEYDDVQGFIYDPETLAKGIDEIYLMLESAREGNFKKAEKHPLVLKNDSHTSPFAHIFVLESGTDAKKIENFKKVYNFVTTCAIKSAILSGGAYYRSRMAGDTVHFGGMTRKVKKLLWQSGLSPKARDSLPILCDEKGIVWLPGFPPREDMVPGDGEETAILCCVMP